MVTDGAGAALRTATDDADVAGWAAGLGAEDNTAMAVDALGALVGDTG